MLHHNRYNDADFIFTYLTLSKKVNWTTDSQHFWWSHVYLQPFLSGNVPVVFKQWVFSLIFNHLLIILIPDSQHGDTEFDYKQCKSIQFMHLINIPLQTFSLVLPEDASYSHKVSLTYWNYLEKTVFYSTSVSPRLLFLKLGCRADGIYHFCYLPCCHPVPLSPSSGYLHPPAQLLLIPVISSLSICTGYVSSFPVPECQLCFCLSIQSSCLPVCCWVFTCAFVLFTCLDWLSINKFCSALWTL